MLQRHDGKMGDQEKKGDLGAGRQFDREVIDIGTESGVASEPENGGVCACLRVWI